MNFSGATPITLGLLIAFGLVVMYTIFRNSFDSNLPIIFYVAFFAIMHSIDADVPLWLIGTGFGLSLVLRFEFMNNWFMRLVKFLELGALGAMIYLSAIMLWNF